MQIGAHVGVTGNDPLYAFFQRYFDPDREQFRPNWRALLVEPVHECFRALRRNYMGLANMAYEEAAIAALDGPLVIRTLSCDPVTHGLPDWASQLSSIVSDPAERPGLPVSIQEFWRAHGQDEVVQGLTLRTLIARHGLDHITLLQIDAEGADADILESIDFGSLAPEFINFERINLGTREKGVRLLLRRAGYWLINWGDDTFCVRTHCVRG